MVAVIQKRFVGEATGKSWEGSPLVITWGCQRFALAFNIFGVTNLFGNMKTYRSFPQKNADTKGSFRQRQGIRGLPRPFSCPDAGG